MIDARHPARLAVVDTHPVQYRAPVYRELQRSFRIPVTAVYGSNCSIVGYEDAEFNETFAWDTDLLSGYESIFLSSEGREVGLTKEIRRSSNLRTELQRLRPTAVLLVGYSPSFHQLAFYHTLRLGLPILFRAETTDTAMSRNPLKALARRRGLRWLYDRCRRLLYVGENSYRHFKNLMQEDEKLVFSPYCVDATHFEPGEGARRLLRPSMREGLGIERETIVLFFCGKLNMQKGPDLLIRSVKELQVRNQRKVAVLFVGNGEMRGALTELASDLAPSTVHFAGFRNQRQLSPYYHAADLLILPSRHPETWGLVVNEALHHGLPCVVSDAVGCAPDLVHLGTTGEVCQRNSVQGLVGAIERGLHLIDRSEIREACRAKVSAYSIEAAAQGIARAFSECGPGKRPK